MKIAAFQNELLLSNRKIEDKQEITGYFPVLKSLLKEKCAAKFAIDNTPTLFDFAHSF